MRAAGWGLITTAAAFDAAAKVKEYAAAVGKALEGFEGRLLLEPGRFLVAQAGALVTRVLQVKKNGKKTFVITDAAMNDLIRPALYQAHHEIVPVRRRAGRARLWTWWVRYARPEIFCARPEAGAGGTGGPGGAAGCGRVRDGAEFELQHAAAGGGGAGGRRKGAADPKERDDGGSAGAGDGVVPGMVCGVVWSRISECVRRGSVESGYLQWRRA